MVPTMLVESNSFTELSACQLVVALLPGNSALPRQNGTSVPVITALHEQALAFLKASRRTMLFAQAEKSPGFHQRDEAKVSRASALASISGLALCCESKRLDVLPVTVLA